MMSRKTVHRSKTKIHCRILSQGSHRETEKRYEKLGIWDNIGFGTNGAPLFQRSQGQGRIDLALRYAALYIGFRVDL
jgi:hypothetical protein